MIASSPLATLDGEGEVTAQRAGLVTLSIPARHEVFITMGVDGASVEEVLAMKLLVGGSRDPKALFTFDGRAADPDTVTFRIRRPDGTISAFVYGVDDEVERRGLGYYQAHVEFDAAGRWVFGWEGSGECDAFGEVGVNVETPKTTGAS